MKAKNADKSVPPLFAGMKPEHLRRLEECSMYAEFGAGDVIFREGEPANCFYLIKQGKVALEADMAGRGLIQIAVLTAGAPLGWSWLVSPHCWRFHARALQRTVVTYYDGKRLRQLSEEDHDFGYELLQRISEVLLERLQSTRGELLKMYAAKTP